MIRRQANKRMNVAHFRFHGELADLLAPARRGAEFTHRCAENASLKNAIESLGVPHCEVGAILAGGEPCGFGRPVRAGDRIEVHPAGPGGLAPSLAPDEAAAAAALLRAPPPRPDFAADSHLGGLARRLRLLGFDTLYRDAWDDRELAATAADGRIVLSRDRELLKHRAVEHGRWLRSGDTGEQLREVVRRFALGALASPFTRCLDCNVPLQEADKASVLAVLPESVAREHSVFRRCPACGKVYWPGSHWRRMRAAIGPLLGLPDDAPAGVSTSR